MTDSKQNPVPDTKKVKCWPARIVGILGLMVLLFFGAYAVQDIPTEPGMIPLVFLWGIMFLGACIDIVLVGREGIGGLIILGAGIASYLFLLFWLIMGWESNWIAPAILGSAPLMISGYWFNLCRRWRKKLAR